MRLIDADELFFSMTDSIDQGIAETARDEAPTIDAVTVIRCRDCKYAKKIYLKNLPWLKVWEYSCQYFNTHSVMGDGYCNNAERKEK